MHTIFALLAGILIGIVIGVLTVKGIKRHISIVGLDLRQCLAQTELRIATSVRSIVRSGQGVVTKAEDITKAAEQGAQQAGTATLDNFKVAQQQILTEITKSV